MCNKWTNYFHSSPETKHTQSNYANIAAFDSRGVLLLLNRCPGNNSIADCRLNSAVAPIDVIVCFPQQLRVQCEKTTSFIGCSCSSTQLGGADRQGQCGDDDDGAKQFGENTRQQHVEQRFGGGKGEQADGDRREAPGD